MMNNSLYGNYRQEKFTDIFPDSATFLNEYKNNGIKTTIADDTATTLYYLLYSRYGNNVLASSDTNRFKYGLWGIVFSYGPTWEKRLEIQEKIRELTDDDLFTGATQIYNHAYNPGTTPSTATLEELTAINEQNTNKTKRSKLDGYSILWNMLQTDVTQEFLNKFKYLFLTVVQPEIPLWYVTDTNPDTIIGDEEDDY